MTALQEAVRPRIGSASTNVVMYGSSPTWYEYAGGQADPARTQDEHVADLQAEQLDFSDEAFNRGVFIGYGRTSSPTLVAIYGPSATFLSGVALLARFYHQGIPGDVVTAPRLVFAWPLDTRANLETAVADEVRRIVQLPEVADSPRATFVGSKPYDAAMPGVDHSEPQDQEPQLEGPLPVEGMATATNTRRLPSLLRPLVASVLAVAVTFAAISVALSLPASFAPVVMLPLASLVLYLAGAALAYRRQERRAARARAQFAADPDLAGVVTHVGASSLRVRRIEA
jgi:hypothetical protein